MTKHIPKTSKYPEGMYLNCECEELAITFRGEWPAEEVERRFTQHVLEDDDAQTPRSCKISIPGLDFLVPTNKPHDWVHTKVNDSLVLRQCSLCHAVDYDVLKEVLSDR